MKNHLSLLTLLPLMAACQATPLGTVPAASSPQATYRAVKNIPVGKTPHGVAAAGGFVYSSDTGDAQVSVIDPRTQAVVKVVPIAGGAPGYIKAFHDGRYVLVADKKLNAVHVIDPAQDHAIVQRIPVGLAPDKIVIDEDDTRVLVSLVGEPKATLLTFEAARTEPPLRRDLAVGAATGDHREVGLEGDWVVTSNNADNNVTLVNLATGAPQTVSGGNNPGPVGIGTANESEVAAIVGNIASNTISFFELPGGTAKTLGGVGLTPTDMVVDPLLYRAYVTMAGSNEVAVVDYLKKELVGKIPVGKRPVHILMAPILDEAGAPAAQRRLLDHPPKALSHELWVGNDAESTVTVIDGENLRVKATVETDAGHHKMAFLDGKVYVSNMVANTVSIVDRGALPR